MVEQGIKNLIFQARNLSASELQSFSDGLIQMISGGSAVSDSLHALCQLFTIVHVTRNNRRLPQQLCDALVKILLLRDKSLQHLKTIASAVLSEMAPLANLNLPQGALACDENQIPYILPVVMNQVVCDKDVLQYIGPQIVRWLTTVGYTAEVQSWALAALGHLAQCHSMAITKDHQHVVDCQLMEWLQGASVHQAPNPYARRLFKRDEEPPVTEIDGQVTKNFFTALCVGNYYTDDQLMNLHGFSVLQEWLLYTRGVSPQHGGGDVGPTLDSVSSTGDSSPTPSMTNHTLEDASLQYCLRILDQWDRKPKVSQDAIVQQACVLESIMVLDQLCQCDPTLTPRVFEAIKRLYGKLNQSQMRLLLGVMQYFLNYSEVVVYDPNPLYEMFFSQVLSLSYSHPAVAFDTIMFIQDNQEILTAKTRLLTKFFPNIFKILAWNPRCYVSDFVELLPAFISSTTAIEVLHTLLDLPLVSAALELTQRMASSDTATARAGVIGRAMENFTEPRYKPFINFILRAQAGQGDTIDRLSTLHDLLRDVTGHPRVVTCADTIPILLRIYFNVVVCEGEGELASTLVPVILERSRLLYNIPVFQADVRSVFADQLVALFQLYPHLMMDQYSELLDFISLRNVSSGEDFFVHIMWLVGEYLCVGYDSRCTPDKISAMYEAIETLVYEVSGLVHSGAMPSEDSLTSETRGAMEQKFSARLLTSIMSTLAKLASRSQDLIPRVMLCLTKLSQPPSHSLLNDVTKQALSARGSELINLLKVPNIAAVVLSPQPGIHTGRWHTENTSLPAVLHAASFMLEASQNQPVSAGKLQ